MTPIDKKLMEILVCPVSKKELVQKGEELICFESKLAYPIKDGIPVMIPLEARKLKEDEIME
tara:strand:+ start:173 stop:358 length:186 start_codon:yes stop_codon:yes gene_type:complete